MPVEQMSGGKDRMGEGDHLPFPLCCSLCSPCGIPRIQAAAGLARPHVTWQAAGSRDKDIECCGVEPRTSCPAK